MTSVLEDLMVSQVHQISTCFGCPHGKHWQARRVILSLARRRQLSSLHFLSCIPCYHLFHESCYDNVRKMSTSRSAYEFHPIIQTGNHHSTLSSYVCFVTIGGHLLPLILTFGIDFIYTQGMIQMQSIQQQTDSNREQGPWQQLDREIGCGMKKID